MREEIPALGECAIPAQNRGQPEDMNSFGQVVGFSPTDDCERHAFLYRAGLAIHLNDLLPPDSGWTLSLARAINDAGQIVAQGSYKGTAGLALLRRRTHAAAPAG
jgi:probable HAF family extracellular repeat protein